MLMKEINMTEAILESMMNVEIKQEIIEEPEIRLETIEDISELQLATECGIKFENEPVVNEASLEQCVKCLSIFQDQQGLDEHECEEIAGQKKMKKRRAKNYQCELCLTLFCSLSALKTHLRSHTAHSSLTCKRCDKTFTRESYMSRHNCTKVHRCHICDKVFANGSNLSRHRKMHSKYRERFQCDICGMHYSTRYNLKQHKITHTDNKKFQCSVCERKFFRLTHLKSHMVTHTGDRRFQCANCLKWFAHMSNLKSHMAVHMIDSFSYDI